MTTTRRRRLNAMSRLLSRVAVERRVIDAAISRLRSAAGAARKRRRQESVIVERDKSSRPPERLVERHSTNL
jgi:hypothetical protein